ncbi:glycosyltransferase family protein [Rhodopila globiformis]|uniref:hypothetical protein n=1 Tax=Rhodopila globiformis TaxID=1071 RepID=UPI0011AFE7BA|nr:hypothetical protein [Rhodopila globiformis]
MTGPETPAVRAVGSVTAVIVADDAAPDAATLTVWGEALAELFGDVELVIVANGLPSAVALELDALCGGIPDLTIHFLADRIDHDAAVLVGLDTALGDWVLLGEPRPERLPVLHALVTEARQGYQVLAAVGGSGGRRRSADNWLASGYFWLYRRLTGRTILRPPPVLRLYSRAAALFIAGSADGEMLLKAGYVAGGLPAHVAHYAGLATDAPRARTWRATVSKATRELLSATTIPLRLAALIALTSGLLSLLYSLYVVAVYLLKPDVLPGWTTLSLQISGMMFLFSLLFALMAEYVLGIYRGLAPRRRYVITRELRSPKRRHATRLNVVGEDGSFHLGMSDEVSR